MNLITAYQADRLIAQIREEADPSSPGGKKLFDKLGKLGTGAIPKILDALASADKRQTVEYVEVLSSLISEKTLPLITRGLADSDPREDAASSRTMFASAGSPSMSIAALPERMSSMRRTWLAGMRRI